MAKPMPPQVFIILDGARNSMDICLIGLCLFFFFYHVLDWFFIWLRRFDFDLIWSHQTNLCVLEILNKFLQTSEERQRQREQTLNKMTHLVNYKRQETTTSSSSSDCAICLETFADDETCRIFLVCNHIFHLNCIDGWLEINLTCPLCRNCILDA
ncbi:hypothetical protein AB3S75_017312 [Citrus x aurantiifolia]